MIVIDIDQDFFYHPTVYNNADSVLNEQQIIINIKDFINKYKLHGLQYTIFRDHNQLYYFIEQQIGKIDKLLHFDAHEDFYGMGDNDNINIGNWVSHLVSNGLCSDYDWIVANNDEVKKHANYNITVNDTINNVDYTHTTFDYKSHSWQGSFDYVFFTISPGFCNNNNVLHDFVENM